MSGHFTNPWLGPLSDGEKATFSRELEAIVDRLRQAPVMVSEKVMEAIERAYTLVTDQTQGGGGLL